MNQAVPAVPAGGLGTGWMFDAGAGHPVHCIASTAGC